MLLYLQNVHCFLFMIFSLSVQFSLHGHDNFCQLCRRTKKENIFNWADICSLIRRIKKSKRYRSRRSSRHCFIDRPPHIIINFHVQLLVFVFACCRCMSSTSVCLILLSLIEPVRWNRPLLGVLMRFVDWSMSNSRKSAKQATS